MNGIFAEHALPPIKWAAALLVLVLSLGWSGSAFANGIFRNGVGARAMGLSGANVALPDDALGAMGANVAGWGTADSGAVDLGLTAGVADGHFPNTADPNGALTSSSGLVPDLAWRSPSLIADRVRAGEPSRGRQHPAVRRIRQQRGRRRHSMAGAHRLDPVLTP